MENEQAPADREQVLHAYAVESHQTLHDAARYLADCLSVAITTTRPSRRGRKSELAGDLYVRGAAEALGITVTHMSRIVTGRSRPGMDLASRISRLSGCTLEQVLAVSSARAHELGQSAPVE